MTCMEKQLAALWRQFQEKVQAEQRRIREFDAALSSADAQMQAEIDRIQAAHMQRRERMMSSLAGLARTNGTLPSGQTEDQAAMEHNPVARIAWDRHEPESIHEITEFTRSLRESPQNDT